MDNKKIHTNKAGSNNYPDPDIPVEEAWKSMKQLLQQPPAAPASQNVLGKSKLLTKIIAVTGSVVIVSTVIYMMAAKKETPQMPPVKQTTEAVRPHRDTLADGSIAYLDYTNKVFEFSNMPFREVSAYLEKAYNVRFILKNNKLDDCTITTRFDNRSLEEILDILGYTLAFEYEIDKTKNQVIISGNGCN